MRNKERSDPEIPKSRKLSVFVSYRTTEANTVRCIVDVLRSNRIDIWFAEYCIPLDVWIRYDYRGEILGHIEQGIRTSDHFIAFSSPGWYASEQTSVDEFLPAIERFGNKAPDCITNIVLVKAPIEDSDDPLLHIPRFEHDPTNLGATLGFLEKRLGRHITYKPVPRINGRELVISSGRHSARVSCSPLRPLDSFVMKGLQGIVLNNWLNIRFYFLPKRITGQLAGRPQRRLLSHITMRNINTMQHHEEDRRLYCDYALRARHASKTSEIGVVGLHLVWIPAQQVRTGQRNDEPGLYGKNTFSITKCGTTSDARGHTVERDYSFLLWNGHKKAIGELLISAGVVFPGMDAKSAMAAFLELSQYIDHVALSTVYEGTTNKASRRLYAWRSLAYLVVLTLVAFDVVAHSPLLASLGHRFMVGAVLVGIMYVACKPLRCILRMHSLLSTITFRCYDIDDNGTKSRIDVKREWFVMILLPACFLSLLGAVLYLGCDLKITPALCLVAVATMVFSRQRSIFTGFWFSHHYGSAIRACNSGNFMQAANHFKRSLDRARAFGEHDNRQASALYNLAVLAEKQGRSTEAIELYREAMRIYQQAKGPWPDHTDTIKGRLKRLKTK